MKNMNDEELFNSLIDQYANMIRAICRRFYIVGGTSDDLYQEAMIGFLEAIRNFDLSRGEYGGEAFTKYAMTSVKRKLIDAIKHANTQKNQILNNSVPLIRTNNEDEEFEINEIGSADDPEELYILHEKQEELLKQLLEKLSPFELNVLKLYLSGMASSEIATKLGKSPRSITNTIQRIKLKVKK